MRKMPEIKADNGFVTSIDGNAIPTSKLYGHYIVFNDSNTDKCYTFLIDDNPTVYNDTSLKKRYPTLKIPCYGLMVKDGKGYQYIELNISGGYYTTRYARANLETNEIDSYSKAAFIKSDTVTPLN